MVGVEFNAPPDTVKKAMDDESGESMEPMEEVPLVGLGESELERLMCG